MDENNFPIYVVKFKFYLFTLVDVSGQFWWSLTKMKQAALFFWRAANPSLITSHAHISGSVFSLQWIHELLTAVSARVIASKLMAVFQGFYDQVTVAEI